MKMLRYRDLRHAISQLSEGSKGHAHRQKTVLPHFPFGLSTEDGGMNCEIRGLLLVLRYYKRKAKAEALESAFKKEDDTHSTFEFRQIVQAHHLKARVVEHLKKRDVVSAIDAKRPILVALDGGARFNAVIYGYSAGHFFVMRTSDSAQSSKRCVLRHSTLREIGDRRGIIISKHS